MKVLHFRTSAIAVRLNNVDVTINNIAMNHTSSVQNADLKLQRKVPTTVIADIQQAPTEC